MARPRKKDDRVKALVVATLKRAVAVVEGSMVDKSTKPAEGAYPVALELGITGDITVGAAVPAGEDREVPMLNAEQVLVGILAGRRGPADRRRLIEAGALKVDAMAIAADASAYKAAREETLAAIAGVCEDNGLMNTVPTPGRAGAVSGKPAVTVHGSHGENPLTLEVDAA